MKKMYLTSKYEGLNHESTCRTTPKADSTLFVDPETRFQRIKGFGGAFTEAATYTLSLLPGETRDEVLKACFDKETGLGYNLGRVHIQSCDFALESYTYMEENDTSLSTFSIEREKRWVIPSIKDAEAIRGDKISLLASPWSPPGWMKTNGRMDQGGKLLPRYKDVWAKCYIEFLDRFTKEGMDIFAVSVQNEPEAKQVWESCIYTAEEERDFVKDHLGPALAESAHKDTGIIIWDHNRDRLVPRVSTVLKDEKADRHVDGIGIHWYVSEEFENLSEVHKLFPDKPILFTEGCIEGGPRINSFATGEHYARNMIGDFSNHCTAYIDWNLALDEKGGPNHVGNFCDALIICDTEKGTVHYNSSYYAMKHFAHHIVPGARRIKTEATGGTFRHVAFKNPDGSIVVVLQNESERDEAFEIRVGSAKDTIRLDKRSIATLIY